MLSDKSEKVSISMPSSLWGKVDQLVELRQLRGRSDYFQSQVEKDAREAGLVEGAPLPELMAMIEELGPGEAIEILQTAQRQREAVA